MRSTQVVVKNKIQILNVDKRGYIEKVITGSLCWVYFTVTS